MTFNPTQITGVTSTPPIGGTGVIANANKIQELKWGLLSNVGSTNGQSYWKNFGLKPFNDMRTLLLGEGIAVANFEDIIRGKIAAAMPLYLTSQTEVVWGGLSAAEGDTFTIAPSYTFKGTNSIYFESPRTEWRSEGSVSSMSLDVYQTTAADTQKTFNHDAFSVISFFFLAAAN